MAIFVATLTIPAGTPLLSPIEQRMIIVSGEITNLRLYVPPGPRGEIYLHFKHGGVQLAPARLGTWWRPDDITLDFPFSYPVTAGDTNVYLVGASPNANFDHAVIFEVTVTPQTAQVSTSPDQGIFGRFANLFGG